MKMSIKEKSGIKGLDKVIGGGLRKNSLLLVIGGPGTGKSIMGMLFRLYIHKKRQSFTVTPFAFITSPGIPLYILSLNIIKSPSTYRA